MKKLYKTNNNNVMSLIEHLEELRTRLFIAFSVFCIITSICFTYVKQISYFLQKPALGIKFLQLAPGEYIFVSIKIALYCGIIFSSPFIIYQIVLFILPGLTQKEALYIIPILITSLCLFFTGIYFSYQLIIPATLKFLITYGYEIIEPIWSFEEYFNFIFLLLLSTGIIFQIPVIQIILGCLKIISSNKMLKYWKNIIFISTIIAAIITPSTDPITQVILSIVMSTLYFVGIFVLKALNK